MNFFYISNLDIKMLYMTEDQDDDRWMYSFFHRVRFFAQHRVKKYDGMSCYDDLIQEAELALWIAIKSFDYKKNFDFYRWAQWNISSKVRNFLYEKKRNCEVKSKIVSDNLSGAASSSLVDGFEFNEFMLNTGKISKREKNIIIDSIIHGKTLLEIGEGNGLSAEGVRKIKNKAILKLKGVLN